MTVWLEIEGRQRRVQMPYALVSTGGGGSASVGAFVLDGVTIEADTRMLETGVLSIIVGGRQFRCALDGDAVTVDGDRFTFEVTDPRSLSGQKGSAVGADGPRAVKAPMPGRVVRVLVETGDLVEENQGLLVIEAMKMQNELKSPKQGRVVKMTAEVGSTVTAGDVLVVVE